MQITRQTLDDFIETSDKLGGPDHPDTLSYWRDILYVPTTQIDTSLDPDSIQYFRQMEQLYEEISSRTLDQQKNELTHLDVEALVNKESPYAFSPPTERTKHYLRLAKAIASAEFESGAHILDMGCGWGLSSEFLAQLGFKVTAVDINPLFASLVRQRAARLKYDIEVREASFDSFTDTAENYDAIVFYESLHHATSPRTLLMKASAWLKPNGKLVLAGEPIQALYWPNWGLRLDPLSVYCIRKFGWFESGWSKRYLCRTIAASGLLPIVYEHPDTNIGTYVLGKRSWRLVAAELWTMAHQTDWWLEADHLVSNKAERNSKLTLDAPAGCNEIHFEIWHFGEHPIELSLTMGDQNAIFILRSGENTCVISDLPMSRNFTASFNCESWCPKTSLGTTDERLLGFHLKSLTFR